jgi:hemoglobin-like flavoprotein
MTPESAALVRASWALLAPEADAVAADFYRRVLALHPEAADLFAHVDLGGQRTKFVRMLDHILAVVDDPHALIAEVAPAGRRHLGYGVAARDYTLVGAALQQALAQALGGAWTPAVREAWRELYARVAGAMLRAARPA